MRKSDRHLLIKQIIAEHSVGTQEELLQLLEAQGVTATQATISRDIRDLKIVKQPDETGQTKFVLFQGMNTQENEKSGRTTADSHAGRCRHQSGSCSIYDANQYAP